MPTVQELLFEAITKKLIVVAVYQGFERAMCPHVLGYKRDKNGNVRLNCLFYQFAGGSRSGLPPNGEWRCVHVPELQNVRLETGAWHTGMRHTQPQNCVDPPPIAIVAY